MRQWPPPLLSRFAGGPQPACEAVMTPATAADALFPSGYQQPIAGTGIEPPVPLMQTSTEQFTGDMGWTPAAGEQAWPGYTPGFTLPGIVGAGLLGSGAIAFRTPQHGTLTPTVVDGFTVYLDANGNPA